PGTGAGGAESARTPGMVGRERRGGRQRRAGRAGTYTPLQPGTPLDGTADDLAGLRKGAAASVVPRPRKHRRDEARSVGRGMPSGRGLSAISNPGIPRQSVQ
ncbi:MAG: hypothetical protein PPP55_08410, partial [Halorubrum sp.]